MERAITAMRKAGALVAAVVATGLTSACLRARRPRRRSASAPRCRRPDQGRRDYGAIGTVTNLAARLCSEATDGQILVSSRVASAAESFAGAQEVGSLTLKGLSRPVRTFNIGELK